MIPGGRVKIELLEPLNFLPRLLSHRYSQRVHSPDLVSFIFPSLSTPK